MNEDEKLGAAIGITSVLFALILWIAPEVITIKLALVVVILQLSLLIVDVHSLDT